MAPETGRRRGWFRFFVATLFAAAAVAGQISSGTNNTTAAVAVNVGVIVDMDRADFAGQVWLSCVEMAVSEFYGSHPNYTTRVVITARDSRRDDVVQAAASALDLIKNVQVQAILGPDTSMQANFLIPLGEKAHVPIVSFSATSPTLASIGSPYFFRAVQNDSTQVHAVAAIFKAFGWRQAVPIYVDDAFGQGIIPSLVDSLQAVDARVPYRSAISPSATDDQIGEELYKLMTMQTRVFIVHVSPDLGPRLFVKAKEVGMMSAGYVWIITDGLTVFLPSFHPSVLRSMQGVLGVKPHVPQTQAVLNFTTRWRRKFQRDHPYGLRAYDATWALAMAVEKAGAATYFSFESDKTKKYMVGVSRNGQNLMSGKKLRIGVPVKPGFREFVSVSTDPETNETTVTGYCMDVFEAVVKTLPYALPFEYVPFAKPNGESNGSYNDLVNQVFLGNLDAVVGDITIIANRSNYVDFTLPYTESGVSMVVPVRPDGSKNAWSFLKPLTWDLWVTTFLFFLFIGFVVWVLEHRISKDFRGPPSHQAGTSLWFSFSTMAFAQRRNRLVDHVGIKQGRIVAAFDEVPYIKLILAKRCSEYMMIDPTYKADGFGFVFPKGSPLVPDISRAILNVTEGDSMTKIEETWIGKNNKCPESSTSPPIGNQLGLNSFWSLFLIAGVAAVSALCIFSVMFVYEHRKLLFPSKDDLHSNPSFWRRVLNLFKTFDEKDLKFHTFRDDRVGNEINLADLNVMTSPSTFSVETTEFPAGSSQKPITPPLDSPSELNESTEPRVGEINNMDSHPNSSVGGVIATADGEIITSRVF
ncbi:unnamed protein product [Linum tenue]|uniref:Glutamate receptor n=2 Tax=Linum tenue TaxID=586396 RepID=A0AAV0GVF3_9ROSI|nr:unnamed protein product [Linum tenue]CAI0376712.1 unnamed protein product [Linum tenue]